MLSQITQRILSLVMALVLVFSLLPLGAMAEETESQVTTSETTSSTEATDPSVPETTETVPATSVPEMLPVTTAAESTSDTTSTEIAHEETNLALLQEKMDAILLECLGKTVMSEEEVLDAVNAMFWDDMQAALDELNALEAEFSPLSEEEIVQLEEHYAGADTIVWFYETLQLAMTPSVFAATGSHTPVTGVTVGVSGATDNSMTNGAITVTAKGDAGFFGIGASAKTATITVYNKSGSTATISFDWTATSVNQLTIDGTVYSGASSSFSKLLAAEENFAITIVTAKNGTTNKLVMSNFAIVQAADTSKITFKYDSSLGSITVNSNSVQSGTTLDIDSDSGATVTATAKSGATFLGWVQMEESDKGGARLTPVSSKLTFASDATVYAVFVNASSNAWFLSGGTNMYNDLNAASDFAKDAGNKTVVLMHHGKLPAGDYTIDSGVTLLIPFDDANTLYTTSPGLVNTDWLENNTAHTTPKIYRTLTMASGAKIKIDGAMSLSAKVYAAHSPALNAGTTDGPYGHVQMESGSSITVNGCLYTYGYITGSGSVTANKGATVYECFQINDFRGGTQTEGMQKGVFPSSQYYVQNIEVPLTLYAGAAEYGITAIHAAIVGGRSSTIAFIGSGDSMFNMTSGYVTKRYDGTADRLKLELHGDMDVSSLELSLGGDKVNSANYELAINSNITLDIKSGSTLTINQDIALLPGCQVIIEEGATCTLGSGTSVYVYDKSQWAGYVGSNNSQLLPVQYAPSKAYTRTTNDLVDAKIQVDGELDASAGYLYTTSSGANIHSTGSGVVKIKPGSEEVTYQLVYGGTSTYPEIPITSAKLKNADETYVETAGVADTYRYYNGKWCRAFYSEDSDTWYNRLNIVATNIAVNDGLDMYFYVLADAAEDDVAYRAEISKPSADTSIALDASATIYRSDWESAEEGKYLRFKFADISAKEMTDEVEVKIYHSDGTQVSMDYSETVQRYTIRTLANEANAEDTKLKTALIDMLNYGAGAQNHFKYHTNALANVDPDGSSTISTNSKCASIADVKYVDDLVKGTGMKAVSVSAKNKLMLTFYFAIGDPTANGYTAHYSYTDHDNISHSESAQFKLHESSGYYYVDVEGLSIIDGGSLVTCEVKDSSQQVIASGKISVEGYVARNTKYNGDVYQMLMRFVDSAYAYFAA